MVNSCELVEHGLLVVSLELVNVVNAELLKGARDVDLLKHLVIMQITLYLLYRLGIKSLHKLREDGLFIFIFNREIGNETEGVLGRQYSLKLLAKEFLDDGNVTTQEVKSHGVVVLNGLRHVNDPDFILVVEQIVLAQISVH